MNSSRHKLHCAYALLSAPYVAMTIWLLERRGVQCAAGYLIAAGVLVGLLAYAVKSPKCFLLLNLPVFVLACVFTLFTIVEDNPPGYPIAFVLLTSSWEEVRAFFAVWQYQRMVLGVLAVLGCYLYLAFSLPLGSRAPSDSRLVRWTSIGGFAVLAAVAASNPAGFIDGMAQSPLVGTVAFLRGPFAGARDTVQGKYASKIPYSPSAAPGAEVHILIVGESSRRASWSVYGYSRSTTPYLESIKDQAIFFSNAMADGNITVYSVPMLMTGIDPEHFTSGAIHGNLVDLAREAGYSTSWLVNNDAAISYMIGMKADRAVYPHSSTVPILMSSPPDGMLLPEFRRVLAGPEPRKFIGLHVFGSHMAYSYRYTNAFARWGAKGSSLTTGFSDQALLDSYDNSLLYTDWFLKQVIESAKALEVPATVTYVSDHGEELPSLDGRSGHGFPDYTPKSFEIPAFVWMNSAYRKAHPERVRALLANQDKQIRSHDFFYSLADLMGIRWPGYLPQRSFASESFAPDLGSRYLAAGGLVARTQ